MRHEVIELAERDTEQPVCACVHKNGKGNTKEDEEQIGDSQIKYVAVGDVVELAICEGDDYDKPVAKHAEYHQQRPDYRNNVLEIV